MFLTFLNVYIPGTEEDQGPGCCSHGQVIMKTLTTLKIYFHAFMELFLLSFISQELKRTRGYKGPVDTRDQWLPGTSGCQGPMASREQGLPRTRVLFTWTWHSRGPVATRDQGAVDTVVDQVNKQC